MIKPPPDLRKDIAPHRVFFNWEITHECNYKCIYCSLGCGSDRQEMATVYPGTDKLIEIWHNVYERYGSCEIHFAGGEPFVYPDFMNMIEKISEFHTLEFSTNFFWDPDDFIRRIRPERARIGVSFHPQFVDFDTFFLKASKIKKAGFEIWGNYVAYPLHMQGMEGFKERFGELKMSMFILPFKGRYCGKEYPESYTDEQREQLRRLGTETAAKITLDFALNKRNTGGIGKLCRMGQMYAKIKPGGEILNCCADGSLKLGNIFDGSFSLLETPFYCEKDNCPCWRCMVVGEEGRWQEHWPVPPDAKYK
jgi:MoaA/NifB/PqqE/SkfB family radical SAM enzyme